MRSKQPGERKSSSETNASLNLLQDSYSMDLSSSPLHSRTTQQIPGRPWLSVHKAGWKKTTDNPQIPDNPCIGKYSPCSWILDGSWCVSSMVPAVDRSVQFDRSSQAVVALSERRKACGESIIASYGKMGVCLNREKPLGPIGFGLFK